MSTYIQNQKMTLGFAAYLADTLEGQIIPQYLQKTYAIALVDEVATNYDPRFEDLIGMGGSLGATNELHKFLSGQYGQEVNVAVRLHAASKAILGSNKINRVLGSNDLGMEREDLEYLAAVHIPKASFMQNVVDLFSTTQTGMQRGARNRKGISMLQNNMAFHTRSMDTEHKTATQLSLVPWPEDKTMEDGVFLWPVQSSRDQEEYKKTAKNYSSRTAKEKYSL